MEAFKIAHLNIQNVNTVVVFLNQTFDCKASHEQREIHAALEVVASLARLAGNVVVVWTDSGGRTKFIAPPQQHPFFKSVSYAQLYSQANKTLHVSRTGAAAPTRRLGDVEVSLDTSSPGAVPVRTWPVRFRANASVKRAGREHGKVYSGAKQTPVGTSEVCPPAGPRTSIRHGGLPNSQ